RVAVIKVAQRLGLPLATIRDALDSLPENRTPSAADWRRFSAGWKAELDDRIEHLIRLRDQLDGCIGCGCLSMKACPLRNPKDALATEGAGPPLLDPPDRADSCRKRQVSGSLPRRHRAGAWMEQRVAIRDGDPPQLLVAGRVAQRKFREQVLPLPLQLALGDRDRRYRADRPDLAAVEGVAAGRRFVMDRGE